MLDCGCGLNRSSTIAESIIPSGTVGVFMGGWGELGYQLTP